MLKITLLALTLVVALVLILKKTRRGFYFFIPLKSGVGFDPKHFSLEGVAFVNYDPETNLLRVHCLHGSSQKEVVQKLKTAGLVEESSQPLAQDRF